MLSTVKESAKLIVVSFSQSSPSRRMPWCEMCGVWCGVCVSVSLCAAVVSSVVVVQNGSTQVFEQHAHVHRAPDKFGRPRCRSRVSATVQRSTRHSTSQLRNSYWRSGTVYDRWWTVSRLMVSTCDVLLTLILLHPCVRAFVQCGVAHICLLPQRSGSRKPFFCEECFAVHVLGA